MSTFANNIKGRLATDYADFLIPHLTAQTHLLDVGCGAGELTVGLAPYVDSIQAIDQLDLFRSAKTYVKEHNLTNVSFSKGDVYGLDFPDNLFDVVFCHSTLEALKTPARALQQMHRVLKPDGLIALASVEYSGLIVSGGQVELLKHFYQIRETLWQTTAGANPFTGQKLRGLLHSTGFKDVTVTTKSFSYGTERAVKAFGVARAADCHDPWYRDNALEQGLATASDLDAINEAWLAWSRSPDAYLAFPWCRAIGNKDKDYS